MTVMMALTLTAQLQGGQLRVGFFREEKDPIPR
jgi:hypothetical protein